MDFKLEGSGQLTYTGEGKPGLKVFDENGNDLSDKLEAFLDDDGTVLIKNITNTKDLSCSNLEIRIVK